MTDDEMIAALIQSGRLEPVDWRVVGASGIVYTTGTEAQSRAVATMRGDRIERRLGTAWEPAT